MQQADQEAIRNNGIVPEPIAQKILPALMNFVLALDDVLGGGSSESDHVKDEMGARAQREFLPYLLLTRTGERMYSKPRGHADDYLTIDWMYQNQPEGTGRLGALLDKAILEAPATRAVRNRIGLLADEIMNVVSQKEGQQAHITSLASGPAREIFEVLDRLEEPSQLDATLIDINLQALAYVSDQLEKRKLKRHIKLAHGNLVYLATGKQALDVSDQDLVYSIGLIDYFDDKFVVLLLN
jgi:extracellular factor (EF) 3-hydroxypalmitic acid methyl ester biosynthesis protein